MLYGNLNFSFSYATRMYSSVCGAGVLNVQYTPPLPPAHCRHPALILSRQRESAAGVGALVKIRQSEGSGHWWTSGSSGDRRIRGHRVVKTKQMEHLISVTPNSLSHSSQTPVCMQKGAKI